MKKISTRDCMAYRTERIDTCDVCGNEALYILKALSYTLSSRYVFLCNKHRLEWMNKELKI